MTVIAFRPRPRDGETPEQDLQCTAFSGVFRSPRGRTGTMTGELRMHRLVIAPRGAFVTGVFTGTLLDFDGTVVGVDSRRRTVRADLLRGEDGLRAVIRPMQLDLMGLCVDISSFEVLPTLRFPRAPLRLDRQRRPTAVVPTRLPLR